MGRFRSKISVGFESFPFASRWTAGVSRGGFIGIPIVQGMMFKLVIPIPNFGFYFSFLHHNIVGIRFKLEKKSGRKLLLS